MGPASLRPRSWLLIWKWQTKHDCTTVVELRHLEMKYLLVHSCTQYHHSYMYVHVLYLPANLMPSWTTRLLGAAGSTRKSLVSKKLLLPFRPTSVSSTFTHSSSARINNYCDHVTIKWPYWHTMVHVLSPVVYDGDDVWWSIGSSDGGREAVTPLICNIKV